MGIISSLDNLVDDIYLFLQGKKIDDPTLFDRFGSELGDVLRGSILDEHSPGLRMSNIGRKDRQLWYERHLDLGLQEKISGAGLLKFSYGHILEAMILVLAEAAGHTIERKQEELEVDGIPGHIDAVIDGVLVDLKSASPYSFNKFVSGEIFTNDPFGYLGQICGYAHSLKLPAAWLVINKVSGELFLCKVPQELIDGYDVRRRIQEIRTTLDRPDEPPRCYEDEAHNKSGNRKLGVSCSWCGWKRHCWRDANGGEGLKRYDYSNGTVWLTQVVREPRVDIVEYETFSTKK